MQRRFFVTSQRPESATALFAAARFGTAFSATPPLQHSLPVLFFDALEALAPQLVHFENELATTFAFFCCHHAPPAASVTYLVPSCNLQEAIPGIPDHLPGIRPLTEW
jgi:hypothetical protein